MIKMTEGLLDFILEKEHEKAAELRKLSGLNGLHDGSDFLIQEQIRFYMYGYEAEVPPAWEHYVDQYKKENDEEYKTYLRLKEKFEL